MPTVASAKTAIRLAVRSAGCRGLAGVMERVVMVNFLS
jgi:hypothetical protein